MIKKNYVMEVQENYGTFTLGIFSLEGEGGLGVVLPLGWQSKNNYNDLTNLSPQLQILQKMVFLYRHSVVI